MRMTTVPEGAEFALSHSHSSAFLNLTSEIVHLLFEDPWFRLYWPSLFLVMQHTVVTADTHLHRTHALCISYCIPRFMTQFQLA